MGVPAWLSIPAPIAIGGGTGGRQAPPAGVCPGFLEPSRAQREDVDIALMGGADTARGLLPPDPCMRLPLDVRVIGRAVWFSMRNSGWSCRRVLWVPAPIAFGGGVGGQPAPRVVSALVSGTLMFSARGCGKRSDEWSGHRPGVAPPDPRMRLPRRRGSGRTGEAFIHHSLNRRSLKQSATQHHHSLQPSAHAKA